jgi:hypothetical protein
VYDTIPRFSPRWIGVFVFGERGDLPVFASTSIPPWQTLQAVLALMGVAGRYALQNPGPADNSWFE